MSKVARVTVVAHASDEVGWGHAMRTRAVVEQLVHSAAPTLVRWATVTPEAIRALWPPCAVEKLGKDTNVYDAARAVLVDVPTDEWDCAPGGNYFNQTVCMVDSPTQWAGLPGAWRVCPHFGAATWDFGPGPVLAGPRYMPLRGVLYGYIREGKTYDKQAMALGYKVPEELLEPRGVLRGIDPQHLESGGGMRWWQEKWSGAFVPPSTMAYECMALGLPVVLLPSEQEVHQRVADGMVAAGVAITLKEYTKRLGWMTKDGPADEYNLKTRTDMAKRAVRVTGAHEVATLLLRLAGWAGEVSRDA